MSSQFNRIAVLDLEATCWEDKFHQAKYSEITEIGLALIDVKSKTIVDKRSIYVLPKLLQFEQLLKEQQMDPKDITDPPSLQYPVISPYCTELTGITRELLFKRGKPLVEAIAELTKNYPVSKTWMSWGDYDLKFLKNECVNHGLAFPFKEGRHINLKNLFGLLIDSGGRGIGLSKATEILGLKWQGKQHCGADDAYMTALVAMEIMWKRHERRTDYLLNSLGYLSEKLEENELVKFQGFQDGLKANDMS